MKSEKIIAFMIFILGLVCFSMYFVYGNEFHIVSFNSNGGSIINSQKIRDNELVFEPSIPLKEGYQFDGWYLGDTKYDFRMAVTENMTLNAKWDKVYNVSIKIDGNEYSYQIKEGDRININKLNIPMKDGYNFNLYSNQELFDLETVINSDLSLEGRYE